MTGKDILQIGMTAAFTLASFGIGLKIGLNDCEKAPVAKPVVQVQKYRFGEQCPDGLRVEYINTVRLPKSIVCQKMEE